jgi:hypothetical protein
MEEKIKKTIKEYAIKAGLGIDESYNPEKVEEIAAEVCSALGDALDKYAESGELGVMETLIGAGYGFATFLCCYAFWHNPELNANAIIRTENIVLKAYDAELTINIIRNNYKKHGNSVQSKD